MSRVALRYLALGDSYTTGTGASHPSRNFPSLLAARLEATSGRSVDVSNPAVNGFTTADLIREELPQLTGFRPDLLTVLIGVNDLVAGDSDSAYRRQLGRIYGAIRQRLPAGRTTVISIPDFSLAPAAARFGAPPALRARVDAFNRIADELGSAHGFRYLDLVPLSRSGVGQPGWFADDQLHPGDRQYAAWADWLWENLEKDWLLAAHAD